MGFFVSIIDGFGDMTKQRLLLGVPGEQMVGE
jgi:hypothetical protein